MPRFAFVLALCLVAGCYRSNVRSGGGSDAGLRADAPVLPIDAPIVRRDAPPPDGGPAPLLEPCDGAGGWGAMGYDIRCGTLALPLVHDDPARGSVDVYVEAVEPPGRVTAQLWMLQGGPGGSTTWDFEPFGIILQPEIPGLEVLLLDHRGTGRSSRIVCDGERVESELGSTLTDAEWSACVDLMNEREGELRSYSTTEAARDLGDAIEALRRPGVPVFVYGVSYGTYWAHRWLTLFPDQADGVIFDSTCSPDECSFPIEFGRNFDRVARRIFEACAADAACRARVGTDPTARFTSALATFDAGGCAAAGRAGLTPLELRRFASSLIADPYLRNALPALALRASRCAEGDETAFRAIHSLFEPQFGDETRFEFLSYTLYAEVARSELWDRPSTPDAESAIVRTLMAYSPMSPGPFEAWDRIPTYDPGPIASAFATSTVPVMIWQGALDPQTSVEDAAPLAAALSGPFQTYVELPRATHGILARHGQTAGDDCGIAMLRSFVADPRAPVDTGCADQEAPFFFDDESLAGAVFGTSSLWEPTFGIHTHALSLRDLEIRERLRETLSRPPLR